MKDRRSFIIRIAFGLTISHNTALYITPWRNPTEIRMSTCTYVIISCNPYYFYKAYYELEILFGLSEIKLI